MSTAKKIQTDFDDQVNAKIQKKFDLVFTEKPSEQPAQKNENFSTILNDDIQFDTGLDDGFVMEKNGNDGGDSKKESASQINLDFSLDDDAPVVKNEKVEKPSDDGLDFSLDFDMDAPIETTAVAAAAPASSESESDGFTLDDADIGSNEMEFDEATKKTVMISKESLTKSNLEEFSLEPTGSHSSADLMSSEEAKANIESTIKDILRPKLDGTKEMKVDEMTAQTNAGLEDIEDSELSFRDNTPSKGFVLEEMGDDAFAIDTVSKPKAAQPAGPSGDATGEFDIGGLDDADFSLEPAAAAPVAEAEAPIEEFSFETPAPVVSAPVKAVEEKKPQPQYEAPVSMGVSSSSMPTEDSMRFQATIRALREEREELLAQMKTMKADSKELEQDNLTLKANLDEAKIEITILRKRHMVELEDLKYRLTMSDEKKAMADEKARHADMLRAKLEQKVRIDYNQVKQREKELESKLELLSMDVDSQVQSRDQKILELRRKIDALEFNMENASIKEQKSLDDKRKLEDRLNKIMKTLRHSIKNLEEDIDEAQVDDDNQKEKI